MKIVVSNPSVAPYVKQSVLAYQEHNCLERFYTSFFQHAENKFSACLIKYFPGLTKDIERRAFTELPIDKFRARPIPELVRVLSSKKLGPVIADKVWEWAETGFDKWVAGFLSQKTEIVHTYEHAALYTLKKAKLLKIFSVYEQPSQHHSFFSMIIKDQLLQYPELKTSATNLLWDDKAVRRNKRRDEELKMSDLILCNSSFTKKTLVSAKIDANKISIIPYGFSPVQQREFNKKNKVIFLNAGTQNLRKGLHILYKAWRICDFSENEAELWLVGSMNLPNFLRSDLPGKVVIKENIPHAELLELYKQVDVFVLPTLADGFGMVISESMSGGVPVITTENSAGPDIINHMQDGWLIKAGEVEGLVQQMRWCITNKERLPDFGKKAVEKAKKWQWDQYREKLPAIIREKYEAAKN